MGGTMSNKEIDKKIEETYKPKTIKHFERFFERLLNEDWYFKTPLEKTREMQDLEIYFGKTSQAKHQVLDEAMEKIGFRVKENKARLFWSKDKELQKEIETENKAHKHDLAILKEMKK